MRSFSKAGFVLALAAGLSSCGTPKDQSAAGEGTAEATIAAPAISAPTDGRPASFAQCAVCHSVKAGTNGIGPSLAGVFGQKAGHLGETYKYSDALKASGLTWDEASLDEWLTMPSKKVPGTKMVFAGQSDPTKRKELIEFLKTLK
jgi:cytochrome c